MRFILKCFAQGAAILPVTLTGSENYAQDAVEQAVIEVPRRVESSQETVDFSAGWWPLVR